MIITRTLMGVGECRFGLRADSRYLRLMQNPEGYVVVFRTDPRDPDLSRAVWTFRVTRVDDTEITGEGLGGLLASFNGLGVHVTAPQTYAAQSLSDWLADLLPANSITVGTTSNVGLSSWAGTWQVGQSLREFLADVMRGVGGAEWRINGQGELSAAGAGELFRDGEVIFTPSTSTTGGVPRAISGVTAGQVNSIEQTASRVLVAGQGEGPEMLVATQAAGGAGFGLTGAALEMTAIVDAPDADASGVSALASLHAGLRTGVRRAFDISTDDLSVWEHVEEGDTVWMYDPERNVTDPTNFVPLDGQLVAPVATRVHTISGPIPDTYSVFWLYDQTNSWADLTQDVVWSDGDVLLRCGDGSGPIDYVGGGSGPWLGDDTGLVAPPTVAEERELAGRSVADNYAAGRGTVADNRAARAAR